jgi:uncharacterized membrane protein
MTPATADPKPVPKLIAPRRRVRIGRNKMSDAGVSIGPARFLRMLLVGVATTAGLIFAAAAAKGLAPADVLGALGQVGGRLHAPNLAPLAAAAPQIKVHVIAVSIALAIGIVLLLGLKGNKVHRILGWIWVGAMATAAISSLFIHRINTDGFSFLHLFAGWTLVALPMGVFAARKHNVRLHGRTMTGLFVGGLLVAGAFAFLPGRLMWQVVFG